MIFAGVEYFVFVFYDVSHTINAISNVIAIGFKNMIASNCVMVSRVGSSGISSSIPVVPS